MPSSILCDNFLLSATIEDEDTIDNFPLSNAVNSTTSLQTGFFAAGFRTNVFNLGFAREIDTVAFVKHNFFSTSPQVYISAGTSASGPWTVLAQIPFNSDDAVMYDLPPTLTQYVQLLVSFPSSDAYLGNLSIGKRVDISAGQYTGFTQPRNATRHEVTANITRSGEVSGLLRRATPVETKIEARHLTKQWVDDNWRLISDCITKYPFYFRWETGGDTVYCWAKKINSPKWDSIRHQSFTLDCEGLV